MQRDEHFDQSFLRSLDLLGIHQSLADHSTDQRDIGRSRQQISEQSPRDDSLTAELCRWGFYQSRKLILVPVLDGRPSRWHLLFHLLPFFDQQRVFRVLRDLIHLQFIAVNFDVIFVRERVDVTFRIELRASGSTKDLVRDAGVDQLLFSRRAFQQFSH